jgi:pilus assembly protein CpaB
VASRNLAQFFLIGSVLTALGGTWGIVSLMNAQEAARDTAKKAKVSRTVTVVAASRTLYQGVEITADDLYVIQIPPEYLPMVDPAVAEEASEESTEEVAKADSATSKIKAQIFTTRERVIGQVPRERILKNEIIRPERLADVSSGVGLNAFIQRGMRAVSIDLTGSSALTHFLQPGNYVDVLVTIEDDNGAMRTEPLMQSVFVLAVNSRAENEDDDDVKTRGKQTPSVTFMVMPEQAEELAFAAEIGKLAISLRNIQDTNFSDIDAMTLNAVLRRAVQPGLADDGASRAPAFSAASRGYLSRPPPPPEPAAGTTMVVPAGMSAVMIAPLPTNGKGQPAVMGAFPFAATTATGAAVSGKPAAGTSAAGSGSKTVTVQSGAEDGGVVISRGGSSKANTGSSGKTVVVDGGK